MKIKTGEIIDLYDDGFFHADFDHFLVEALQDFDWSEIKKMIHADLANADYQASSSDALTWLVAKEYVKVVDSVRLAF